MVLIGVLIGYKTIEASGENAEILDIIEVFEQEEINIQEWSLYTKGSLDSIQNEKEFDVKIEELTILTKQFSWSATKEGNQFKAVGVRNYNNSIKEKITLATTFKSNTPYTYLIYEATGTGWSEEDYKAFLPIFNHIKTDILLGDSTNFSCVKGNFNDNIEEVLYDKAEGLLNEFDAQIVELVNEETFVSITAYTKQWVKYLPTINGKMNVQLALRNIGLGGKTTVVIGTPIITSEY